NTPTSHTIRGAFDEQGYPYILIDDITTPWTPMFVTIDSIKMAYGANQLELYRKDFSISIKNDISDLTVSKTLPKVKPVSQSTAVSDITAPAVTTIEEANTAIQELVTTINNMLATDRASGQRAS